MEKSLHSQHEKITFSVKKISLTWEWKSVRQKLHFMNKEALFIRKGNACIQGASVFKWTIIHSDVGLFAKRKRDRDGLFLLCEELSVQWIKRHWQMSKQFWQKLRTKILRVLYMQHRYYYMFIWDLPFLFSHKTSFHFFNVFPKRGSVCRFFMPLQNVGTRK